MDAVRAVSLLGLRLAALQPRLLAGWYGDPSLRRQIGTGAHPRRIAADARSLADGLWSADLTPAVRLRLEAILDAIQTHADQLAGDPVVYISSVHRCYRVQPALQDVRRYADAHDHLAALLPGTASLARRLEEHRRSTACPPGRLREVAALLAASLREQVVRTLPLPADERVTLRTASRAWNGFACGTGDLTTSVTLSTRHSISLARLARLVAHETYPGHHTQRLLRPPDLALDLVGTPLSVTEEGLAEHALAAAVGPGWGLWLERVLAPAGIRVDGAHLQAVSEAAEPLGTARADAALLLHDRGASRAAVTDHLQRWALSTPQRAQRVIDFVSDPVWSGYVWAGVAGARSVGLALAQRPPAQPVLDRFAALLRDPPVPERLPAVDRTGTHHTVARVVHLPVPLPG